MSCQHDKWDGTIADVIAKEKTSLFHFENLIICKISILSARLLNYSSSKDIYKYFVKSQNKNYFCYGNQMHLKQPIFSHSKF